MKKEKVDLELRPHHIYGFYLHEKQPEFYYLSDEEYIKRFRQQKEDFHSDKLILHWRDTIKKLHENPNLEIRLVPRIDSVCKECNWKKECNNKKHWAYKSAQKADEDAMKFFPELKLRKIYNGHSLITLFKNYK